MVGDGSYLMMNSEIATSVAMGLKLTIVLLDNGGFGCIDRLQQATGGAPFNNLVPHGVDLCAHAASLGALAERVRRPGGTGGRRAARAGRRPHLGHRRRDRPRRQHGRRRALVGCRGARSLDRGREVRAARAAYDAALAGRDDTRMTVRLGTNPIGWSNDDLRELGGETPLETCLAEARRPGSTASNWATNSRAMPRCWGRSCDRHDLALVSGWYSSSLLERDAAAELDAMRAAYRAVARAGVHGADPGGDLECDPWRPDRAAVAPAGAGRDANGPFSRAA